MAIRSILIWFVVILTGCSTVPTETLPNVSEVEYRIGGGDKLNVTVFREAAVSGEFVVDAQGNISLPLVGDVPAGGKTVAQFRDDLTARLAGDYFVNPSVSVSVVSFRPVYILGEVVRPGEYASSDRMSVYALIAKAGGFTYRANQSVVFVRRETEVDEKAYKLTSGAAVLPGDTVRIVQSYF